jgi:hypothetical protein
MKTPGDRLHALATKCCSAWAMERVLGPSIADLRWEYRDACRRHQIWRARWIHATGSLTMLYLIAMHASLVPPRYLTPSAMTTPPVRPVIARSAALVAVMTAALIALVVSNTPVSVAPRPWLLLYLLPATLPVTVPFGFGVAISRIPGAHRDWRLTCRMALVAAAISLLTFATIGWITPSTNQSYRVAVFGRPVAVGFNELTWPDMRRQIAMERERLSTGGGRDPIEPTFDVREAEYTYQSRLAVSLMSLVTGLFAFGLSARRRPVRVVGMISTLAVFSAWYGGMRSPVATFASLPPTLVAWLPNALSVLAAVILLASPSPAQTRMHRSA